MTTPQQSNGEEELTNTDDRRQASNRRARGIQRHVREAEEYGAFGFLNPTTRRYAFGGRGVPPVPGLGRGQDEESGLPKREGEEGEGIEEEEDGEKDESSRNVKRVWRTRDNRKGRHAIETTPGPPTSQYLTPPSTSTFQSSLHTIRLMFTTFPYYDVSYLVAILFTIGSIVWVINAFFVWLPLQLPSSEFPREITSGGGITAFLGATIFEIGSVFLMCEAVNEKRGECFGWAVEEVLEGKGKVKRVQRGECGHHHGNKGNLVGKGMDILERSKATTGEEKAPSSEEKRSWTWFPCWYELRTHYFREIGFLACLAQMIGATIFWISGFTALPSIYNSLEATSTAALNGAYWLPQVVGGTGFIVSGILFMLETQKKWYLPAWGVLGWHIGAWNLLGGIGFTLCGALGFAMNNSGCVYQSSLATFWGGWCFLIGSVIQWFESLEKFPVDVREVKASGG